MSMKVGNNVFQTTVTSFCACLIVDAYRKFFFLISLFLFSFFLGLLSFSIDNRSDLFVIYDCDTTFYVMNIHFNLVLLLRIYFSLSVPYHLLLINPLNSFDSDK
jgi:hypothetical protein